MEHSILDIIKVQGSGFNTPKGYFDTIENDVFSKLSLEKIPEKAGYSIPENYFDSIERNTFSKIDIKSPSKEHSFDVPKDYFNTIEDTVFKKIQQEDSIIPKVINLKSRLTKVFAPLAVAASLLLLFTLYTTNTNENYSLENLAVTDIENWIENDYVSLDSYEIAEVYSDINFEDEFSEDDIELLDYINGTDIESALLTE
jgi:hypothetical protein